MATLRAWQLGPVVRKLHCHEVINRGVVAAHPHGQLSVDEDRPSFACLAIDQRSWAHVGYRLDHTRRLQGDRP